MIHDLGLAGLVAVFVAATLVITVAGTRITGVADRLADQTGLGEALVGGILLGLTTSLPGTVVSIAAALDGHASLAFANGVGGIAAQTAFLAVADIVYRRANLEHASADLTTLFQAALLLLLLSGPLIAFATPEVAVAGVHPVSLALVAIYLLGARSMTYVRLSPMWRPVRTPDTYEDRPDPEERKAALGPLAIRFVTLAAILGASGWVLSVAGTRLSVAYGLSETLVGALLTAVATSLPELVTTLAAVRRGATQLAVGIIVGGNCFDVLFLSLSDLFYRDGSLYHAVTVVDLFWLSIGIAMTALLLLGLILRERRGMGGIGFESAGMIVLYLGAVATQSALG